MTAARFIFALLLFVAVAVGLVGIVSTPAHAEAVVCNTQCSDKPPSQTCSCLQCPSCQTTCGSWQTYCYLPYCTPC